MHKFWLAVLIAAALLTKGDAQNSAKKPDGKKTETTEIHELYLGDQGDRGAVPGRKPARDGQMAANDAERRRRAHELLDKGALKTAADFGDAAFIFQHGDSPDDYLLAHVLAMVAVRNGDPRGQGIAAASLDRYLQSIGKAQVFGTQYLTRSYAEYLREKAQKVPAPKVDQAVSLSGKSNPDEWIQQPYNTSLISDFLRAQYCVPALEDQEKQVTAMNQGKDAPPKHIPGCSK